ncbi:MAG: TIGR03364 family FAD-dependent oxidoreductase [Planctomycetaceae bacterium]|nr:MAG: TIGR03364 family FAD-dependent oxidoreductase [Planctomycetaceae bacterium]
MSGIRVGIVGAGIVGLAHAWSAAVRDHRVTVFERSPRAIGASIRNFGMVWPVGQPPGTDYRLAMRSRRRWLKLARDAGVWVNRCGSVHLAYREDERAVMTEFASIGREFGVRCRWLDANEVLSRWPVANPDGLLGGLHSPTELAVNPPAAVGQLANWLRDSHGVEFHFGTLVAKVQTDGLRTADGRGWDFDRIVVCGGADARELFPDAWNRAGIRLCKLQMLGTDPQPNGWRIGTHIAGGLTLRHYRSFEICPSLGGLRQRIAAEHPELDRYGIHVMASQDDGGRVILGDSHEYDEQIEPFDKEEIDGLILRELRRMIRLPQWSISRRWHGVYAKHPQQIVLREEPQPEVHLRTATGGAGMTFAFGLAESDWDEWAAERDGR